MELSKFYHLVMFQNSMCTDWVKIETVAMLCVKDVFLRFIRDDCLPRKVTDKNRRDVTRLITDTAAWSKAKVYLLLNKFPQEDIEERVEHLFRVEAVEVESLIDLVGKLRFWQFNQKSALQKKLALADKELTLDEEFMFLWKRYLHCKMGTLADFKVLVNQATEKMVAELVNERVERYKLVWLQSC